MTEVRAFPSKLVLHFVMSNPEIRLQTDLEMEGISCCYLPLIVRSNLMTESGCRADRLATGAT